MAKHSASLRGCFASVARLRRANATSGVTLSSTQHLALLERPQRLEMNSMMEQSILQLERASAEDPAPVLDPAG